MLYLHFIIYQTILTQPKKTKEYTDNFIFKILCITIGLFTLLLLLLQIKIPFLGFVFFKLTCKLIININLFCPNNNYIIDQNAQNYLLQCYKNFFVILLFFFLFFAVFYQDSSLTNAITGSIIPIVCTDFLNTAKYVGKKLFKKTIRKIKS